MKKAKSRPDKNRKIFEIIPREKNDPLSNDPFSTKNIIIPIQNIDKNFLQKLGIHEDMLPQNMRTRSAINVVDDSSSIDPEVYKVLYGDDDYEEMTDQLIEEANIETKNVAGNGYGYIMSKFLNDLGGEDVDYDIGGSKIEAPKFTTSLGTSCATSRRSKALQEFDERFQRFLDRESESQILAPSQGKRELTDADLSDLSHDLDKLMNLETRETEEIITQNNYSENDDSDSTIHSDECEDNHSVRRTSSKCMFSSRDDGSLFEGSSFGSRSSCRSQPRLIVHSGGSKARRSSVCEESVNEVIPELPEPDFSQIDRKVWKAMVKEDRRAKRQRKKETKIMFGNNKLVTHHMLVNQPKKHLGIL